MDAYNAQEQHEMTLERTHPSGAEEWHCHTCGRRILMTWPPNFKRVTLVAGDESVAHSGGKGGIRVGAAPLVAPPAEVEPDVVLSPDLVSALDEVLSEIEFEDDDWDDEE